MRHPTSSSRLTTPAAIISRARTSHLHHSNRTSNRRLQNIVMSSIAGRSSSGQLGDYFAFSPSAHANITPDSMERRDALISNDYDTLWELSNTLGYVKHNGATKNQIRSIPVQGYVETDDLDARKCSICQYEFNTKESLKKMPNCSHPFHAECLDRWLQIKATCPVCRQVLNEEQQQSDGDISDECILTGDGDHTDPGRESHYINDDDDEYINLENSLSYQASTIR